MTRRRFFPRGLPCRCGLALQVLARAEPACLKTGVRSRGPRVRIPPPPLRTAEIWLCRALLLLVVACGDDSTVESSKPQPATEAATVHHIHGLGVGPQSGELYVATH